MGLFDFLKGKNQPTEPLKDQAEHTVSNSKTAQNGKEPYLGDLDKTRIVHQLTQVPHNERDEVWTNHFLDNVGQASFRCTDPQILNAPDGFPYFQLFLPEPNTQFQCYVIDRMKDDFLLEQGYGVVVNPFKDSADWVFSYGDILNYALNGEFYNTKETLFSNEATDEDIDEEEEILIGQPSEETILPQYARNVISEFLKSQGVKSPKVLIMVRKRKDGKGAFQDLVFNLMPSDFGSEEQYRMVAQALRWFLPRHYSMVLANERSFPNGFQDL